MKPEGYSIIIDTDSYTGSFEREMCAYITGVIGECEVGKEIASKVIKEIDEEILLWFQNYVSQVPDEHGCCRPVAIAQVDSGNRPYHGVEIFFEQKPSQYIINVIKERAKRYVSSHKIKIIGFRLIETKITELFEDI